SFPRNRHLQRRADKIFRRRARPADARTYARESLRVGLKSRTGGQPGSGALSRIQSRSFGATGPLPATDRIEAIDALRGLALFGVLIINLVTEFRVSIFEQFLAHPSSSFDRVLEGLLMMVLAQK